jgi:hypothetical protein
LKLLNAGGTSIKGDDLARSVEPKVKTRPHLRVPDVISDVQNLLPPSPLSPTLLLFKIFSDLAHVKRAYRLVGVSMVKGTGKGRAKKMNMEGTYRLQLIPDQIAARPVAFATTGKGSE